MTLIRVLLTYRRLLADHLSVNCRRLASEGVPRHLFLKKNIIVHNHKKSRAKRTFCKCGYSVRPHILHDIHYRCRSVIGDSDGLRDDLCDFSAKQPDSNHYTIGTGWDCSCNCLWLVPDACFVFVYCQPSSEATCSTSVDSISCICIIGSNCIGAHRAVEFYGYCAFWRCHVGYILHHCVRWHYDPTSGSLCE